MRRLVAIGALALVVAACSTQSGRDAPEPQATMCGANSPLKAADRRELCSVLAALHEPRLPERAKETGVPVYRALLIIPDQPATAIRVETTSGASSLTVRRLSHGRLVFDHTVPLSAADAAAFSKLVAKSGIESQPLDSDAAKSGACNVPSVLAAEAYENGHYELTISHCAATRPLQMFATGAYQFAAAKLPALEQGLEQSLD